MHILRNLGRRVIPTPPSCPRFKEAELVDSVISTTSSEGEVMSERKVKVPVYKYSDDASFVKVVEVDTDYSLENMEKHGIPLVPVTKPYFKQTLETVSFGMDLIEEFGEDVLVEQQSSDDKPIDSEPIVEPINFNEQ